MSSCTATQWARSLDDRSLFLELVQYLKVNKAPCMWFLILIVYGIWCEFKDDPKEQHWTDNFPCYCARHATLKSYSSACCLKSNCLKYEQVSNSIPHPFRIRKHEGFLSFTILILQLTLPGFMTREYLTIKMVLSFPCCTLFGYWKHSMVHVYPH